MQLELAEEAGVQAFVGALEEVGGVVVEGLAGAWHELVALHLEVEARDVRVLVDEAGGAVATEVGPAAGRNGRGTTACAFAASEGAGGDVIVALEDGARVRALDEGGEMTDAVEHGAAEGNGDLVGFAGVHIARRLCIAVALHEVAELAVVVGVLIEAVRDAGLEALELVVEDEVDDASNGVGAIHGGSPAGEHLHPLEQERRDGVEVGAVAAAGGAGRQALAIQEHQRASAP